MRSALKQEDFIISLSNQGCLYSSIAGGKGSNLAKLLAIQGVMTKPGYVVTSKLYEERVIQTVQQMLAEVNTEDSDQLESVFTEITNWILDLELSDQLTQIDLLEPGKYYAVRSSATVEDGNQASFSGKFATELYVSKSEIANKIKEVWASVFTLSNLEYCQANKIDYTQIKMAVVVQEMSNPISAGTVFANEETIEIDVAPGLGEAVVRGDKPTDRVVINSKTGEVIYEETAEKSSKLVYSGKSDSVIEQPLLKEEERALSLSKHQLEALKKQVQLIRDYYSDQLNGLDIEFSCDADGQVYILQVRPITVPVDREVQQVDYDQHRSAYIGRGDPVSHHVKPGIVAICQTPEEAEEAIRKHSKNIIIITKNTTSQWESVMRHSAGVIAEVGSPNCHTAIACREMRIAGVTGYQDAMTHLAPYQNKEVTLCGSSGRLYQGDLSALENLRSAKVMTAYAPIETENTVPKEKHLAHATAAGMTAKIGDIHYIGKPITPTCELINQLDKKAHQWVEDKLSLPKAEYVVTNDHVLLMSFDGCHAWRQEIRSWDNRKHKAVLYLRKEAEREFRQASLNLELADGAMEKWFLAYQKKIGFDNIAFAIGEVLNGQLHQLAREKGIEEPVLSDLVSAEIAAMGHFQLESCYAELRNIQDKIKTSEAAKWVSKLEELYANPEIEYSLIISCETRLVGVLKRLGVYEQCREVTTSYRIVDKDFSLTFLAPWFQQSSMPWMRLLIESKKLTSSLPQPMSNRRKRYYPDNVEIRSMLELCAGSKKLHMDGHHTKAYGLWKFAKQIELLSQHTGYSIAELANRKPNEIAAVIGALRLQAEPGATERVLTEDKRIVLEDYANTCVMTINQRELQDKVLSFCHSLPNNESLKKAGFKKSTSRVVFPSNNVGLPQQLEEFEDKMRDLEGRISREHYRGEYVRPNRHDYTQHQIALPESRVVTMVSLGQTKSVLRLPSGAKVGKATAYSAAYKWQNPAFLLHANESIQSDFYDEIEKYLQIISEQLFPDFAKKSNLEKIDYLERIKDKCDNSTQLFTVVLNSNSRSSQISLASAITRLLVLLKQEQHVLAMTDKPSAIIRGTDSATIKMQSIFRIPAKAQHEKFLEDTLYFFNRWLFKNQSRAIDQEILLVTDRISLEQFLIDSGVSENQQAVFFSSLDEARKYMEYKRRPKLCAILDDGSIVEVSMNDSIDIPSQALMVICPNGNVTETNRQVNLVSGYKALSAIVQEQYAGKRQDVILSQLAYTQASSTQSMSHFHIVPVYNSEGEFMAPYLDGDCELFSSFEDTAIDGVEVSYLNDAVQANYYSLVKLKVSLSQEESENFHLFDTLSKQLQRWETETGCDMTWVAKFKSDSNVVIICVELRAGINQFTQVQIDGLRDQGLWNKIGFTEVMGKKYSMLTQKNLDDAAIIYDDFPNLKEKMLQTPLYALQRGLDGSKLFYCYQDQEIALDHDRLGRERAIVHIARILQAFDAEMLTKAMAALYALRKEELEVFKELFQKNPDIKLRCCPWTQRSVR